MASACNFPSLSIPTLDIDLLALIAAFLAGLGLHLPPLPSIPWPASFCPLD